MVIMRWISDSIATGPSGRLCLNFNVDNINPTSDATNTRTLEHPVWPQVEPPCSKVLSTPFLSPARFPSSHSTPNSKTDRSSKFTLTSSVFSVFNGV